MYDFRRVDLNGDGKRDALVLFTNPYGYWCGDNGCSMLVMKAEVEVPDYLRDLLLIILGHYFAARHRPEPASRRPSARHRG